jgi:hypothetical protein
MREYTFIRIKKETAEKLKNLGHKNETYDQIINKILNEVKNKKWEKRSE